MATIARKTQSLVSKLAKAANAVGGVPKRGKNDEYSWQKWADVAAAFRHELFKRGIVILANDLELEEKFFKNHAGLVYRYAQLKREYTITDGAETLKVISFGRGMDMGDKAVWKAKTGCDKYLLRELGLIPDEADDPEATADIPEVEETDKQKARLAQYQTRAWTVACKEYGRTEEQAKTYLKKRFNVDRVELLTRTDFDEAVKWAVGREELDKVLEMSLPEKPNGSHGISH